MKQSIIGFDVDGVILNIWGSIVDNLKKRGYDISPQETTNYSFRGHPYRKEIFECFSNPDIFAKANLYDGAFRLFCILEQTGAKYYFKSISYNKDVETAKIKRLKEILPTFDDSKYISVIGDIDKEYTDADIVVEDNPSYFKSKDFTNSDRTGVVIHRPYNCSVRGDRIVRIYNLIDLLKVTDCWYTNKEVI